MTGFSGKRVLVASASGLVAFSFTAELAENSWVYALARWSDSRHERIANAHHVVDEPAE